MEGEGGVPVEAETFAWLNTGASGHGGIGNVNDLVGVVDGSNRVAAGVGGEREALFGAGYISEEAWIATAVAGAKWVFDWDRAAGFVTCL